MTTYEIDPDRSQVWIDGTSSVHPIRATATGLVGHVEVLRPRGHLSAEPLVSGEVRIEVDRLDSGNALVDRETRRRVDARRHPEIVGTVTSAERLTVDRVAVTGDLDFRGEVRSVSGELTVAVEDGELIMEGTQTFDVRDWGLKPPRVGLLRVHPDVEVRIRVVGHRT